MKRQKNYILADSLNWIGIVISKFRQVTMEEITVHQLKDKIDKKESFLLLDVREMFEYYISKIDGSTVIPVDELPSRIDEIAEYKNQQVIVMCRTGSRSAQAQMMLQENGFQDVKNLKGGVNEWAREIDTTLPVY
jgi:rhodanese-related sulfurtransferase